MINLAIAAMIAIEPITPVHAWYEPYCCSEKDCGPALDAEYVNGSLKIETAPGVWMSVPAGMQLRPSGDMNWHVCLMAGKVRCIYAPAGS